MEKPDDFEVDPRKLAHSHGPDTSHGAAWQNQESKENHRLAVLLAFYMAGRPRSTAELNDLGLVNVDLTELRRRATDLLNLGLIWRTTTTDGRSRPGYRLALTEEGRDLAEEVRNAK